MATEKTYDALQGAVANLKTAQERYDDQTAKVAAAKKQLEQAEGLAEGARRDLAAAQKKVDLAVIELYAGATRRIS